jgi:ubiquinone/menaquinone biosynthesis C-methylase UbiE
VAAIDYTGSAAAFRRHRTLAPEVLAAWRRAVTERLPPADHVLDVGAGTGQFSGPLVEWTGAAVTALEPSAAMRTEAVAAGLDARVRLVAGRAEALPLRSATVGAAWLSTVVHQFTDLDAALGELRRVLRPRGRVLVRGYLADQGHIGLFGHFPGIERSIARFPTTGRLVTVFRRHRLLLDDVTEVDEAWTVDLRAWAAAAAEVRHADSMFVALTDEEFAAGLASVQAAGARRPGLTTIGFPLRLVTFVAR